MTKHSLDAIKLFLVKITLVGRGGGEEVEPSNHDRKFADSNPCLREREKYGKQRPYF